MVEFEKQPYEEFKISSGFSKNMAVAESIIIATVTAVDTNGDAATTSVLSDGSTEISGQKVYVVVTGGTEALSPYKLTFRVTTSSGNKWENDVVMRVVDL